MVYRCLSVHRWVCMAGGGLHGRQGVSIAEGHVWQGVCMVGRGLHGKGVCMAGGMHGGGRVWQGGMRGRRDIHCSGTHPTGMHSCLLNLH